MKIKKSDLLMIIKESLAQEEIDMLVNANNKDLRKKAFRKLSMKHHPDRGGKTEDFQELSSLFSQLEDETYQQRAQAQPQAQSQDSWDGFEWDMNPEMPSDFNDEKLKEKIKNASTVSGPYGFTELYVEFLRRQDRRAANIAIKKFNEVNMKEFSNLMDITKTENKLIGFSVKYGTDLNNQCTFDDIYKSLRMLEKTSIILSSKGISGLTKALECYKIGAYFSPLKMSKNGRDKISESIKAFEAIIKKMGFFKRVKYTWLGASERERQEILNLVSKVSSLNSVEGFHRTLYHLILAK